LFVLVLLQVTQDLVRLGIIAVMCYFLTYAILALRLRFAKAY
jgi:hypothetical protein